VKIKIFKILVPQQILDCIQEFFTCFYTSLNSAFLFFSSSEKREASIPAGRATVPTERMVITEAKIFPEAVIGTTALKAEFNSFVSALFILFILLMVASAGMYFLERDVQPDVFGNIPQAMWWAVVTLTTMGYGDAFLGQEAR
jgi:hypothetical protein